MTDRPEPNKRLVATADEDFWEWIRRAHQAPNNFYYDHEISRIVQENLDELYERD